MLRTLCQICCRVLKLVFVPSSGKKLLSTSDSQRYHNRKKGMSVCTRSLVVIIKNVFSQTVSPHTDNKICFTSAEYWYIYLKTKELNLRPKRLPRPFNRASCSIKVLQLKNKSYSYHPSFGKLFWWTKSKFTVFILNTKVQYNQRIGILSRPWHF